MDVKLNDNALHLLCIVFRTCSKRQCSSSLCSGEGLLSPLHCCRRTKAPTILRESHCRAKNTPLTSEASSLSMMLCRNVLQVFIRHQFRRLVSCQHATCALLMTKKISTQKNEIFSRDSKIDMAIQGKKSNHS